MARRKKSADKARRMATWLGIVVVTVGLAAAVAVGGVVRMWRGIAAMPEFCVNPSEASLTQPWVRPEKMRKDFLRTDPTGILSERHGIFESGLAGRVASAYAASPWVRGAPGVRKVFPNRLDVRLDLREPFAVVSSGNRRCCLDRDGVVLSPTVYQLTPDILAALGPEISLPGDVSAPIAGYVWDDAAVAGGLEMLRLCREQFDETVGVERIEIATDGVGAGARHAVAELVLQAGSRVRWGRVPLGLASPAEVSTEQKAEALRTVVRKEGENLGRMGTIDVRWSPTLIRPHVPETR